MGEYAPNRKGTAVLKHLHSAAQRLALLALAAALLLSLAVPAAAIGENMGIAPGTPFVDGEIDLVWNRADRQKLGYITGGEKGKAGASAVYASVLWDEEALYFLFEIIDDDYVLDQPADSGRNDSVYVYIDELGYFGPTSEGYQTVISLTPALGKSAYPLVGPVVRDYEMAFGWNEDGHAVIEFRYVPHTLVLSEAEEILLDFQYNDMAPDGSLACRLNWSDMLGEAFDDSSSWTFCKLRRSASISSNGYATPQEAASAINRTLVTDYTFREGTEGYGGEGPQNLWDGNTASKFCTSTFPMRSVAILRTRMVIDGIIMATANDNDPYNGRAPDDWKIEGSNDHKNWETIAEGDETFFQEVNFTYFSIPVEDAGPYRYIRFSNKSTKSGVCQVSELLVCSTDAGVKEAEKHPQETPAVDKNTLVNYESPERLKAAAAQAPAPADPGTSAESSAGETAAHSASEGSSVIPGVVVCGIFVLAAACALIVIAKRKGAED